MTQKKIKLPLQQETNQEGLQGSGSSHGQNNGRSQLQQNISKISEEGWMENKEEKDTSWALASKGKGKGWI